MSIAINPGPPVISTSHNSARVGLACGLGAYLMWGIIPLYFRLLRGTPPVDIVAHRVIWSLLFLVGLLTLQRKWPAVREAFGSRHVVLSLLGSTALIATNWLVFVWAVEHEKVLQASLGYFINPLVSVLLGVTFLKERLRRIQVASLVLAAGAVTLLTAGSGQPPWIALSLALSFGFYGLLRKTAPVGPLVGLSIETALLLPAAGIYVALSPTTADVTTGTLGLLALAGPITALPLILFAGAAQRLRLTTMGFLQYLAPTCQFLLAVLVFGEPFLPIQQVSFALIWIALLIYTGDSVIAYRRLPALDRSKATRAQQTAGIGLASAD